ncbi:hypothetical protein ACFRSX_35590 [Streptomyces goshikiensis]|uniref:hypothetical protein n=1 Tax=Streptomyces TaxID=1883 RepID=UPI000C26F7E9|nr:hypothetical protein [Streptomyces sp. CB02120-2]PJN17424.1 hypothetical protein CG724_17590 [Streptomyces sp. CB02120-2]
MDPSGGILAVRAGHRPLPANTDLAQAVALSDGEVEAVVEAPAEDVRLFREALVLAYERAAAVPTRVAVRADYRKQVMTCLR